MATDQHLQDSDYKQQSIDQLRDASQNPVLLELSAQSHKHAAKNAVTPVSGDSYHTGMDGQD